MLHSIARLTDAALAVVADIWTVARDRTMPWNAHLILDAHVCDCTEVQENREKPEFPDGEFPNGLNYRRTTDEDLEIAHDAWLRTQPDTGDPEDWIK